MSGQVRVVDQGVRVDGEPDGILIGREQPGEFAEIGHVGADLFGRLTEGRGDAVLARLPDEPPLKAPEVLIEELADGGRRVGKQQPEAGLPASDES
jgi:hypothetical protein